MYASSDPGGAQPVTNFIAYKAADMSKLPEFAIESGFHTFPINTGAEFKLEGISSITHDVVDIVFKSVAGHPFTYSGQKPTSQMYKPTGGTLGSIEVDTDGSIAYKFTGFSIPVLAVNETFGHHSVAAVLNLLLARNDKITGSPFNDVLTGADGNATMTGGGGNDKFVFAPGFGKDVIADFAAGDMIAISHKIFANFEAVQDSAHVDAHHHVVIMANANETITLDTVRHVSDLTASEFLIT
jgi:RTX calcium-binding nonapeptide repeat (4 copies)